MKVLVTGSSGNVASMIARRVSEEATLIGLDPASGPYTTHAGTINDEDILKKIFPGLDAVIHCAAYHAPHIGQVSEKEFSRVNVDGTKLLLDMALKHGVKRFVYTSTTSVYGCTTREKEKAVWATEDLAPNPEDIYDTTKLKAEELCREASGSGMPIAVMRMSRCFPEPEHLMAFYRLYRGVSREDVAEAHWLGLNAEITGTEIFNVSARSPFNEGDTGILLKDPWQVIERIYPGSIYAFEKMKWQKPGSIDRVYVVEKAESFLGFNPKDNFMEFLTYKAGLQN
jgi:UDP-glucose 4-epimerase